MMDSLKQRIVDYVKANQPVSVSDILIEINISKCRYLSESRILRSLGLLVSVPRVGIFAGKSAYEDWINDDEREVMQCNRTAPKSSDVNEREEPETFKSYDPKNNRVVAEYMKSGARQRLMMVYGRA